MFGELYHSERGAIGESEHVFIRMGLDYVLYHSHSPYNNMPPKEIKIFDVGFGSGLNAWLTLQRFVEKGFSVDYHAVEFYPIDPETAIALVYTDSPLFAAMHRCAWESSQEITSGFKLTKYQAALENFVFPVFSPNFDLIYFDAFAPCTQPELWNAVVMEKMYKMLASDGVLTTYSAKGSVKRALRHAGFIVERLPGALGKRHMLRAVKV